MKWLYCLPNDKVKLGAKMWTIIIASNDETRFERCRGSAMTSEMNMKCFVAADQSQDRKLPPRSSRMTLQALTLIIKTAAFLSNVTFVITRNNTIERYCFMYVEELLGAVRMYKSL